MTGCAATKQPAKPLDPGSLEAFGSEAIVPLDAGDDFTALDEVDGLVDEGIADAGTAIFGEETASTIVIEEPPLDEMLVLEEPPAEEKMVTLDEPIVEDQILTGEKAVVGVDDSVVKLAKQPVVPDVVAGESLGLTTMDDIYSSYAKEKGTEGDSTAPSASWKPFEFVRFIDGGYDSLESKLAQKLVGSQKFRLLSPVYLTGTEDSLYIVDDGLSRIFRYVFESEALLPVIDVSQYFKGTPGDLDVSESGYIFVADPMGRRVLKFSPTYKLVGIFEDTMNLARPERVYYDEDLKKLYVADSVYSRILVFNDIGVPLYAVGSRGKKEGQFISITGFVNKGDAFYVIDRIGLRAQKISANGTPAGAFGQDVLTVPGAIAIDNQDRIVISDSGDDTLKLFQAGYLKAKAGGTGIGQLSFRDITDLWVKDDNLYVLERLNRRIQVLKVNPPQPVN